MSQKPHSSENPVDRLLNGNGVGLRLRNGQWQLLTGAKGRPRMLPESCIPVIEKMIKEKSITLCDDGFFRNGTEAARPLFDDRESPWLMVFKHDPGAGGSAVDKDLVRAGERLRRDYEKAHLAARMTAHYAPRGGDTARHFSLSDNHVATLTDDVFAAREMLHRALDAVGPELSGLLLQICCHAAGLEQAERILALPRRTGKAILVLGLTRLARHYGYKPALRHAGPSRIGHWATADYRPKITPRGAQPPHQP
jgi:Domain of unknown function (DUF6456)